MESSITGETISTQEVEDVLVESKMLMGELYIAKIELVRKILGRETFQRAQDFMAAQQSPDSIIGNIDDDVRDQLQALDEMQWKEKTRDILNLDPKTDEEKYHRVWADIILYRLFPDDTVLTVLDDDEKLQEIGMRLKKMIDEDSMYENEYINAYDNACWEVDSMITQLYIQATGQDGIEHIEADENALGIQFYNSFFNEAHDEVMNDDKDFKLITEMSKASVYISVVEEEIRLNNQPALHQVQLEEIRAILQPISKILEDLSHESTT